MTKRCLRWRDAAEEVVLEHARALELPPRRCAKRRWEMLQRSLDVTLVRMCESFEQERRRAHEELSRRQDELVFLATHDPLTGLPEPHPDPRPRGADAGARAPQPDAGGGAVHRPGQLQGINDTLGHGAGDRLLRAVAARLGHRSRRPTRSDASAATSSW